MLDIARSSAQDFITQVIASGTEGADVVEPADTSDPIEEAAALAAEIEKRRAELQGLIARRRHAVKRARHLGRWTVDAIARRARLSQGYVSQVTRTTTRRRPAGQET
jgi:hypothetical protein